MLASRFIRVLNGCSDLNLVLIGVEEKLVAEDINNDEAYSLKHIFVYTWIEKIIERYKYLDHIIQRIESNGFSDIEYRSAMNEARAITKKLKQSIPFQAESCGLISLAQEFQTQIEQWKTNGELPLSRNLLSQIILLLERLNDGDVIDELLATANVIFCTLSSSGVSAMKRTRQVDGE